MEPCPVRVDQIPGVIVCADGDAGDVRRDAEELHGPGVGAAGGVQLPGVGGEGLGYSRSGPDLVGRQGFEVVVEIGDLFPVQAHCPDLLDDRLDEVQRRLVLLRRFGGYGEVVQIGVVVGQVLRYMVRIPCDPFRAAQQVIDCAVVPIAHHGVGVAVAGGVLRPLIHQRLADGVVELTGIGPGEHGGIGLLAEVLPAPVVGADGVAGGGGCPSLRGWRLRERFSFLGLGRGLAGVGRIAVDLHRAVPVDVKAHRLPDVPQLDVVGAIDGVRLQLHLLPVHIDGVPAGQGLEVFHRRVGGGGPQQDTGQEACYNETRAFKHFYLIFSFPHWYAYLFASNTIAEKRREVERKKSGKTEKTRDCTRFERTCAFCTLLF